MTFLALFTKEMRLRMRQERTVWILIIYVLLLGLLGWLYLSRSTSNMSSINYDWDTIGATLYQLLTLVQIVLILCITPVLSSGAISAEKEFETYDLLLCSQLSAFSLIAGKFVAGLCNVLLLIVATIPLFSLVFFFGGFTTLHILQDLVLFIVTAAMITSFALFCSTLFDKRSVSTAIVYIVVLLWLMLPFLSVQFVPGAAMRNQPTGQPYMLGLFIWNPFVILSLNGGIFSYLANDYLLASMPIAPWLAYIMISLGVMLLFFLLSLCLVKPYFMSRVRTRLRKYRKYGGKS